MVILIGGCSSTGKTYLSQLLIEKYKIPATSLDHLKMGLYRSGLDLGFTPTSKEDVITKALWPIIKGMIMTAIENKQHLLLEGCYLDPSYIEEMAPSYRDHILTIFLGFSQEYIKQYYHSGIIQHRCVVENRMYDEDRPMEYFLTAHRKIEERTKLSSVHYYQIHQDYHGEMDGILHSIDDTIQQLKGAEQH